MEQVPAPKRVITNEDIKKYDAMVESFIKEYVIKNWRSSQRLGNDDAALGNSGYTMADMRQFLKTEVCVAISKYNPNYRTKEGKSVKESTFVHGHLFKRIGQLMKKLTKKRYGYGVWSANIDEILHEYERGE